MFEIRPFERKNHVAAYNPFREMEDFEKAFFGNDFWGRGNNALAGFSTDIQDKGEYFLMEADLPGFKKEDIKLDLDGDTLSISAERHSEHEEKDKQGNYIRCERSYGSYQRSFDMTGIDKEAIKAEYKDGVLKLNLPKEKQTVSSARRLTIE